MTRVVEAVTVLSAMNEVEARQCANDIRTGIASVGQKLLELYEREGWRALGYASWRECAQVEFGFKQSYAYRLLSAAEVERNISPIGENGKLAESVLRPLTKLSPDEQRAAYTVAVETAPNGKPTARHVAQVAVTFAKPDLSKRAPLAPAREPFVRPTPVLAKPTYLEPTAKRDQRLSSATALRTGLNSARDLATHHDHLFEYEQGIAAMLSSLNELIATLEHNNG